MCIYSFQVCIRKSIDRFENWDEDAEEAVTQEALGVDPFESFYVTRSNGETEDSAREKAYKLAKQIIMKWPEYEPRMRIQQVLCQCAGPSYVEEEWMFSEGPNFTRKPVEPQVGRTIRRRVVKKRWSDRNG
jgi:hypothetical protein